MSHVSGILCTIDNIGKIRNGGLAISGSSGWHFHVGLAVLNTSSINGLLCCWLEPLAKLAISGGLDCKLVSHVSQLLSSFSNIGSSECVFKPTIKLAKYYPEPNFSYTINILSFLFCCLTEPGGSPQPQNGEHLFLQGICTCHWRFYKMLISYRMPSLF